MWLGPNAVLAFAREGYKLTDVNVKDLIDALGYRYVLFKELPKVLFSCYKPSIQNYRIAFDIWFWFFLTLNGLQLVSYKLFLFFLFLISCGGGVAEWFRALDLKSGVPWFKSFTPPLSGFVLGSPEFNSSTALCK